MTPSLWPPTLATIPLAFGIARLAHWLLLLIGWRMRAADHIAYVVLSVAAPVIWIALIAGTAMRRARRIGAATTFGSARWMDRRSVRRMTRGSGLIIGRENRRRGRLLRYGGPAHLITIAPTRTGKGTITGAIAATAGAAKPQVGQWHERPIIGIPERLAAPADQNT
jgi:type IV secretory pathway TraG/TraD family ATPase VirD4